MKQWPTIYASTSWDTKDGHRGEIAGCITFLLLPCNSFVVARAEKNRTLALVSLFLSPFSLASSLFLFLHHSLTAFL